MANDMISNNDIIQIVKTVQNNITNIKEALKQNRYIVYCDNNSELKIYLNVSGVISVNYSTIDFSINIEDLTSKNNNDMSKPNSSSIEEIYYGYGEFNRSTLLDYTANEGVQLSSREEHKTYCTEEELFNYSLVLSQTEYKILSLIKELKDAGIFIKFILTLDDIVSKEFKFNDFILLLNKALKDV